MGPVTSRRRSHRFISRECIGVHNRVRIIGCSSSATAKNQSEQR